MMKMRYNVNTGLYEYCDRLTGEVIFYIFTKSKKISNDQELIQSDPTSCPRNQKGNN